MTGPRFVSLTTRDGKEGVPVAIEANNIIAITVVVSKVGGHTVRDAEGFATSIGSDVTLTTGATIPVAESQGLILAAIREALP